MLNYLKQTSNVTYTENGAWTYQSSGDYCLDFFATVGALRNADNNIVITRFIRAFASSREYAMKTLFFARDIRGGLGERHIFRLILRYLAKTQPALTISNIPLVAEYGRFDDLLVLLGTGCETAAIEYIKTTISADLEKMKQGEATSLLAKWLPSINTSSELQRLRSKVIAKGMGMSQVEYRKCLSQLRAHIDVLERRLCKSDYTFDYEKLPSKALFMYRAAFMRNDAGRYRDFMSRVKEGTAELKTGSLYPYDIVRACGVDVYNHDGPVISEREILDATWNSLENHCDSRNALAVVDGSGSMYSGCGTVRPIDVAISLGIYFAERNTGPFKNHFITFSENPRLVEIQGADIVEKVTYSMSFNEVANTDLYKTFALILKAALDGGMTQADLPETLYIISDMEFDRCVIGAQKTVYQEAEKLYRQHGYTLPKVIFWNVDSRQEQQPVSMHQTGTALVSGMSPIIFKMVMTDDIDPRSFMKQVLDAERYKPVVSNVDINVPEIN
jgi:hypothetical protein